MCSSVVVNILYCIVRKCVGNRYLTSLMSINYHSRNKCII